MRRIGGFGRGITVEKINMRSLSNSLEDWKKRIIDSQRSVCDRLVLFGGVKPRIVVYKSEFEIGLTEIMKHFVNKNGRL